MQVNNLLTTWAFNHPVDFINWIQRAGLQFAYTNNPLVPDVAIDFESAAISHDVPDGELEESLRKQTFQALGLPPETVDNAFRGWVNSCHRESVSQGLKSMGLTLTSTTTGGTDIWVSEDDTLVILVKYS